MTALNQCIFRKNRDGCHQWDLKIKLSLAIAQGTSNRFRIALY